VNEGLEALVSSLLYEGYALYPYTPGATKNATPTPFGIVYPPAYAERSGSTFDHLRVECVLTVREGATVKATIRFLHPSGERHEATEKRLELGPEPIAALAEDRGVGEEFDLGPVAGRVRLRTEPLDLLDGEGNQYVRVRCCVHNSTELAPDVAAGMERPEALAASLLSTHVVLEAENGRFVSPLEGDGMAGAAVAGCENVNTWPVLGTPGDTAVLAAPIMLPDHPSLAPESLGNLFDNTEIEEALVLHVQVLSDEERAEIERQDPAVREMIERASSVTSDQLAQLHGRMTEIRDPTQGLAEVEVEGVLFRRGGRVVIRPGLEADLQARMLEGRTVTVERIQRDYDGRVHLGVSVEAPGQEILRDTGRFLWFFPPEVEVVE
jgi:hypothetical protein